ncbi:glycosyltransferase family 9 protein [Leeuwenhoekiella marinoflava]|uniref:glycosyltransferase family 9 protein n=1 Tax=Leeuwenhoekiella marinoflava TaxID=988 RepID=UPI003002F521
MKILVIQQKMIGDVLTSSILFKAIREKYPEAELHYLIKPHTLAVVKNNPFIDQFIFDQTDASGKPVSLNAFASRIRNEKYSHILDVYSKLGTAYICLRSNTKTISYKKWYTSFAYSQTVTPLKEPKTQAGLAIENRLQLLKLFPKTFKESVKPKIYLSQEELDEAKAFLTTSNLDFNKPIFMIGLLGSSDTKTYPLEYLAQLLETVVKETPEAQLLLNYIPDQKEAVNKFLEYCSTELRAKIFPEVYAKDLRKFIAVLSFCKALIGNEGGAVNMAKALNLPTFAIFSPWITKEVWALFSGDQNLSVHLKDFKPELFQSKKTKEIKTNVDALYKVFTPQLLSPKFKHFLETIS